MVERTGQPRIAYRPIEGKGKSCRRRDRFRTAPTGSAAARPRSGQSRIFSLAVYFILFLFTIPTIALTFHTLSSDNVCIVHRSSNHHQKDIDVG